MAKKGSLSAGGCNGEIADLEGARSNVSRREVSVSSQRPMRVPVNKAPHTNRRCSPGHDLGQSCACKRTKSRPSAEKCGTQASKFNPAL